MTTKKAAKAITRPRTKIAFEATKIDARVWLIQQTKTVGARHYRPKPICTTASKSMAEAIIQRFGRKYF